MKKQSLAILICAWGVIATLSACTHSPSKVSYIAFNTEEAYKANVDKVYEIFYDEFNKKEFKCAASDEEEGYVSCTKEIWNTPIEDVTDKVVLRKERSARKGVSKTELKFLGTRTYYGLIGGEFLPTYQDRYFAPLCERLEKIKGLTCVWEKEK